MEHTNKKAWWKSWTMWAAAITAASPHIPLVSSFLGLNPLGAMALAAVFAALRVKTKEAVGRKDDTAET